MSSLFTRRLIVWAVSAVLGFVTTWLILTFFLPNVSPNTNEGVVTISRYGIQYFLWTFGPLTVMFMTVLDHFMETKIWPE